MQHVQEGEVICQEGQADVGDGMEIARKKSYTMGLIDWSLWIMLRFISFYHFCHVLHWNPRGESIKHGEFKIWGTPSEWRVDWKLGGDSTSEWGQSWVNRLVNVKGYQTFVAEEVAFKNGDLKLQNWWYPKQILHKATRAWCGEVWQPFWWICHIMFEESLASCACVKIQRPSTLRYKSDWGIDD